MAMVSTPLAFAATSAGVSFVADLSLAADFSRTAVVTAGFAGRTAVAPFRPKLGHAFDCQSNGKASAEEARPASRARLAVIAIKAFL
jgi:hypothetical protein